MKLVMTLVVRDEADIVDAQIAYHLSAGVDFVIATDHRSEDSTTEILQSYARDGYLLLISEDGHQIHQSKWVTHMARLAATEHRADWVINSDADEFWWPRGRSLKEALEAVPEHFGVVFAPMCHFVPRRGKGPFYDVMTVRLIQGAPINDPFSRYRPSIKAAHRGSARVVVFRGNHGVEHAGRPLTFWHPFEVLHFPDRSPEQSARKYANIVAAWPVDGREPGAFVLAARDAIERTGIEQRFDHLAVTDDDLAAASDNYSMGYDTRLRDALRRLRAPSGDRFLRSDEFGGPRELPPPTALDDTRHAVEVTVLTEAELIRMNRRIDDLTLRVQALERRRNDHGLRRVLSGRR